MDYYSNARDCRGSGFCTQSTAVAAANAIGSSRSSCSVAMRCFRNSGELGAPRARLGFGLRYVERQLEADGRCLLWRGCRFLPMFCSEVGVVGLPCSAAAATASNAVGWCLGVGWPTAASQGCDAQPPHPLQWLPGSGSRPRITTRRLDHQDNRCQASPDYIQYIPIQASHLNTTGLTSH